MSVAAIVLAAGFSRRLGLPKQTVEIGGETLLGRAVRVAHEAGLNPIFVVVAPHFQGDSSLDAGPHIAVVNTDAEEGIASSIRAGLGAAQAVHEVTGAVIMTCDQVCTSAHHLRALAGVHDRLTGSAYAGRIGIPAYFPRSTFDKLLRLRGDVGARDLLQSAPSIPAEELALDIDTEHDLQQARALLEGDRALKA